MDEEQAPDLGSISERLSRLEAQRGHDLAELRQELRRFWLRLTAVAALAGLLLGAATTYLVLRTPAAEPAQQAGSGSARCPGFDAPLAPAVATLTTLQARRGSGASIAPLTPVARSASLEVTITSLSKVEGGLRVHGRVRNIGDRALSVPIGAFRFCDQAGTVYANPGDVEAMLQPDQSTELDLTLPIAQPGALAMTVELPDGEKLRPILLLGSQADPAP